LPPESTRTRRATPLAADPGLADELAKRLLDGHSPWTIHEDIRGAGGVRAPQRPDQHPGKEFLEWHAREVFHGPARHAP
jgi:hypothetical protein